MKGISWSLLDAVINYGIKTIFSLYIARLLFPSDYSLIGITYIFFSIIEVLVTSGLGQAYIYKKNAESKTASTIFTINFLLSIFFILILFFSRHSIADYFGRDELVEIIPVLSFVILFNALNLIRISHLRKTFKYDVLAKANILSFILSGSTGLFMASMGFGFWSLVFQQLVGKFSLTLSLRAWTKLKVGFSLDVNILKELFGYSSWLLLNALVNRAFENLYRLVIGKYHDKNQLGLYEKGNQFPAIIYQQVFWAFSSVSFSTYSSMRDTPQELSMMHFKFIKYFNYISIPILLTLYFNAEALVVLVLTSKWLAITPFMKLFCLIGLVVPFFSFNIQLLQAVGRTRDVFFIILFFNIIRLLNAALIGVEDISSMLLLEVIINIFSAVFTMAYLKFHSLMIMKDLLSALMKFSLLSLSVYIALYMLSLINFSSYFLQIFFNSSIVLMLTSILLYFMDRALMFIIYNKLRDLLRLMNG